MDKTKLLIDGLFDKNNKVAYQCLKELTTITEHSDATYKYFDVFSEMLDSDNSYIRSRGLLLISANAKWDSDFKIDEVIDKYLKHIKDIKPITARQCIKTLPNIAKYKPELRDDIIMALRNADTSLYPSSMQPLVAKDIRDALVEIKQEP